MVRSRWVGGLGWAALTLAIFVPALVWAAPMAVPGHAPPAPSRAPVALRAKRPPSPSPRVAAPTPAPPTPTPIPTPVETPPPPPPETPPPPPPPPPVVTPSPPPPPPPSQLTGLAGEIQAVINRERSARGLAPLTANAALTRAAEKYAGLSYSQPDPFQLSHNLNGNVGDRARAEGYYGMVGEVIAVTPSPSAESIVQLWLGSSAHAAIILGSGFSEIGIGCASGPYTAPDGAVWQIALCVAVTGG